MTVTRRPARKHLYSIPRMTPREQLICLGWEVLAGAAWLLAAFVAYEVLR